MPQQSTAYLSRAIVIASVVVFLAALVIVLSPLMWTDHLLINHDFLPSGCQVTTPTSSGHVGVARCPIWVRW